MERRLMLALEAHQSNPSLTLNGVAKIYSVPEASLRHRINGRMSREDYRPAAAVLTKIEEEVVVQYVLDLDARGFPPRLDDLRESADHILALHGKPPVGINWPNRLVSRREDLRLRWSRGYDFQRALCEDPVKMKSWFDLVSNMRAKYGILDSDFYNFDETGFMMGIITSCMVVTGSERRGRRKSLQQGNRDWSTAIMCVSGEGYSVPPYVLLKGHYLLASWFTETNLPPSWVLKPTPNGWTDNETGVDWIKHFDKHTKTRTKGRYRMLVLDGHESHRSVPFEAFCKDHDIIPLCLPPHSSHLTQPLNVGVFGPLKRAYGKEINFLARANITHIDKPEFLVAFQTAYKAAITAANLAGGYRGSGLIPFNPEAVLSKMDVRLRSPSPSLPDLDNSWVSKTPQNSTEALLQSSLVKDKISKHRDSSPSPIFEASVHSAKGLELLAAENAILKKRVGELEKANQAVSKRKRAPKTRLSHGEGVSAEEAEVLLATKVKKSRTGQREGEEGGSGPSGNARVRRCGRCGETGHYRQTCPVASMASPGAPAEETN